MKVNFTQSGGFAGLLQTAELDTERLAPDEARHLDALVEATLPWTGAASHDATPAADGAAATDSARDSRQYELRIEREGHTHACRFDEQQLPDAMRPLVSWLQRHCRPARP